MLLVKLRIQIFSAYMFFRHTLSFLAVSPLVLMAGGGCIFLEAPPRAEAPPTPKPLPRVVFDPGQGQPRGARLNDPALPPLDPKALNAVPTPGAPTPAPPAPNAFRLYRADAGDLLVLQSVRKVIRGKDAQGNPKIVAELGAPSSLNPVQLAGIISPKPPTPGAQNALATLYNWCAGQDLDVDIDPKYPEDARGRRLVHVFYTGRTGGRFAGQKLSLNRMMVRSGYAIVDLYSPTSFDQREWLLDEAFARQTNAGLWKTNAFAALQQRLPSTGSGARSRVLIQTGGTLGTAAAGGAGTKTPKIVSLPPGVKITPPPAPPSVPGGAN